MSEWLFIGGALALVLWFSQRYGWWRKTVPWERPRVLMYHLITPPVPGGSYRGMRVAPAAFERQLQWLARRGFHFATVSELLETRQPRRTVVLTFDDGYADNFTHALPLLQKYRAKATLYLVADREEGSDWSAKKKAHHSTGELAREPKLSDAQVQEMLASGVFELGAHTLTHANLARLDAAAKQHEIAGSKQWLETRFGVPVRSFAYPFGIWDETDRDIVRATGFSTAVTTDAGIDALPLADPLALRRIKVSGKETLLAFRLRLRTGRRGLWK